MTDIERSVALFLDGVAEVRAIGVSGNGPWDGYSKKVVSGFFDDPAKLHQAISSLDSDGRAKGIYITLNPLVPAIIARANNRLKAAATAAEDKHVLRYRWIPIDIDPVRISDISSSAEELAAAEHLASKVEAFLSEHDITCSAKGFSGNGYHLLVAIDEPNTPEVTDQVKAFLAVLSSMFNIPEAKIDTVNFNPARIWKIYGTVSRKGDPTEDRPHRRSKLVVVNDRVVIPIADIKSFTSSYMQPEPERQQPRNGEKFDLKGFLFDKGVDIIKEKQHGSSVLYCLEHCIFDASHEHNESAFGQCDDGKIFYQCFHDTCQGRTWADAKALMGWQIGSLKADESTRKHEKATDTKNKQLKESESSRKYLESKCDIKGPVAPIAHLVRGYVEQATGIFTVYDIDNEICLKTREEKNARALELNRLGKQGLIKQVSGKRGAWKVVDGHLQPMNLSATKTSPLPIWLPLGLSEHAEIYPGNIIIVAGSSNAGKSAFVSTLIRECNILNTNLGAFESKTVFEQMAEHICPGQKKVGVNFFSSEAGDVEMSKRLADHPGGIEAFAGINFWERERDFADVIDPNGFNVIDYMEVYDNFYEIGQWINDVHRALDKGIAVIVIQKKRGADVGKGGDVTLEKPRLYITLESNAPFGGICKVIKCKFPKDPKHKIDGMEIDYKLHHGCEFEVISPWRFVDAKKRAADNKMYEAQSNTGGYVYTFKAVDGECRLNTRDFNAWRTRFNNIDVQSELERLSRDSERRPWMKKSSWFFQVGNLLEKKSMEAGA